MILTLQCQTCHEPFEGTFTASLLWSNWHTYRHKLEAKERAEREAMIRRRARVAFRRRFW